MRVGHVMLDIDDVLFPFHAALETLLNREFKACLNGSYASLHFESTAYNIGVALKPFPELLACYERKGGYYALLRRLGDANLFLETRPLHGSEALLNYLREEESIISLITHRAEEGNPDRFYNDGPGKTIAWLHMHNLPYDFLRFRKDKVLAIQQLEEETGQDVEIVVEDHPRHAYDLSRLGKTVYLIKQPYNQHINPADNWCNEQFTDEHWQQELREGNITPVASCSDVLHIIEHQKYQ
ncbi:MAG: hypothetical protein V1725_03790 [archaeon]